MGGPVKNEIRWNKESADELHKPIIKFWKKKKKKKIEKPELCSSFIDSI